MTKRIRLMSSLFTVAGWTLLSRLFGFARDVVMAAYLGAGPAAQAFLIAFALPNMFRRFFAEGAFNTAFVPMFAKKHEGGEGASEFARDAMGGLAALVLVLTLLAQLIMPLMVLAMASGFAADERQDLAVTLGRIAFPYILFMSLAALLSGVLNALGRFAAAAAAPVLLNAIMLAAMVLAARAGADVVLALAWSVPLAGIAQLALVWLAVHRAGLRIWPRWPRLTPDMRQLAVIAFPALLAGGVVQVNLLIGRQVASYFDGAVAWLSYADRLYQLPLGVVGVAMGVVLLPDLSRRLRAGDGPGGVNAYNRATEATLALTLPAAVALVVVPLPIVSVLFQRGEFSPQDAAATALAVAIYGAGLPAFVQQKVVQALYFARGDTRTPFRYALVAMVVNLVVAVGLAPVLGWAAAALGTTLAAWVMLAQLLAGTRRLDGAGQWDIRLRARVPRIVGSALAMGLLVGLLAWGLSRYWDASGLRYLALLAVVGAGMLGYGGLILATGALTRDDLRGFFRARRGG